VGILGPGGSFKIGNWRVNYSSNLGIISQDLTGRPRRYFPGKQHDFMEVKNSDQLLLYDIQLNRIRGFRGFFVMGVDPYGTELGYFSSWLIHSVRYCKRFVLGILYLDLLSAAVFSRFLIQSCGLALVLYCTQ